MLNALKYAFHVKKRILRFKNKFFTKNILHARWNAVVDGDGVLEIDTS